MYNIRKMFFLLFITGFLLNTTAVSINLKTDINLEKSNFIVPSQYVSKDYNLKGLDFVPGELIIKFRKDMDICFSLSEEGNLSTGIKSIDILNKKYKLVTAEKLLDECLSSSLSNVYKFVFNNNLDVLNALVKYNDNPYVLYAEPNQIYHLDVIPNDQNFSQQWALYNTGQTGGTPDADIDAPEAWDIETGDPDVVIAIIDTGVDYNHQDLADNIWINNGEDLNGNGIVDSGDFNDIDDDNNGYIDDIRGWNFQENTSDPYDYMGHGTHCSGIASAMTNNDVGVAGVCWNCSIMPLKFRLTVEDAVPSLGYACDNVANVVSMSWGSYTYSQLLYDALDYAYSKGVFIVASACNDDTDLRHYPSGYENVISVAATGDNDERCGFSNYGPWVDIGAPGYLILSTLPEDNYEKWCGTSMACPYVAGLAGLLLSKTLCPLPKAMVKTMILQNADEINTDQYIGSGRINAYESLVRDSAIAFLYNTPSWKDNAKDTLEIEGCAWGESLQQFVLEYGRGKNPDTWIEMTSSNVSKNGELFSWDTTTEDEGLYTVRLTVTCIDGGYIDEIGIVINNEYNIIHVDVDNIYGPWDGTSNHPFQYIRDGIDDQGKDDKIYVYKGIYNIDHMFIDKTINLSGEDRNSTIIDGCGSDFIFLLYSSWNNITGFTITNSSIGIYLQFSNFNTFNGNKITNNSNGINLLFLSNNNNISCNIILNNVNGIVINSQYNHKVSPCYNNTISKNTLTLNYKGIFLDESWNNSIIKNIIKDNEFGIYLDHSGYNSIYRNEIKESDVGMYIVNSWIDRQLLCYSTENKIYNNNITNNNIGIRTYFDTVFGWPCSNKLYYNNFINNEQYNAYDKGINYWDNGSVGNYWDDYIGLRFPKIFDPDNDKIGNFPYIVPPIGNNKDRYPLMKPTYKNATVSNKQNIQSINKQLVKTFQLVINNKIILMSIQEKTYN